MEHPIKWKRPETHGKKAATVRNSGCKAREVISVGFKPTTFRTGI